MTDDDTDDTPRTQSNGEHQHSGPYRNLDPVQELHRRVERLETEANAQRLENAVLASSRRTWRWIVGFAVPALLGGMFMLLLHSLDKISAAGFAAGETRTEIKAHDKLIDLLETEVAELRRHAGIAPIPIVEGRVGVNP